MTANESVTQWCRLHDDGYFEKHPHYKEWRIVEYVADNCFARYVNLCPDDVVLEIGCGYGRLMYGVADCVSHVVGIDVHPAPLAKARVILQKKRNTAVMLSDGCSLPFPDDSFDVVYAQSVMQHIPRAMVKNYVVESCRVLRRGGRLCFQFPDARLLPRRENVIDLKKCTEQSIAWTPKELFEIVDGVDVDVYQAPPHSLYLFGVVK